MGPHVRPFVLLKSAIMLEIAMFSRIRTNFVFDLKCGALKAFRALQKLGRTPVDHRFLFILCPPYAGSSLMREIICTSPHVSAANIFRMGEGLGLPEIRRLIDYRTPWDENIDYPWAAIEAVWLKYWDTSKPVLMDKGPPNLFRAKAIQEHFKPAWFILMTRNPYAHSEGLMRRDRLTIEAAAHFCIKCLRQQRNNAQILNRICVIRYEDLVIDPNAAKGKLGQFMPELQAVRVNRLFSAHNHQAQRLPITDFNEASIGRLTAEQISGLNKVFSSEKNLLASFGYDLLSPG